MNGREHLRHDVSAQNGKGPLVGLAPYGFQQWRSYGVACWVTCPTTIWLLVSLILTLIIIDGFLPAFFTLYLQLMSVM